MVAAAASDRTDPERMLEAEARLTCMVPDLRL
jgi:hypothetical protein